MYACICVHECMSVCVVVFMCSVKLRFFNTTNLSTNFNNLSIAVHYLTGIVDNKKDVDVKTNNSK